MPNGIGLFDVQWRIYANNGTEREWGIRLRLRVFVLPPVSKLTMSFQDGLAISIKRLRSSKTCEKALCPEIVA